MKIQLNYRVPVSAIVDLDHGRLEDLLLWPTALERQSGEHDVVVIGTQLPATQEQRRRARRIADSQEWPAWRTA